MKEFFEHFEKITEALRDPEYLFLVLEPLQTWGVAFGMIALIVAYFLKNEKLQVTALVIVIVSALSVVPYLHARDSSQSRIAKVYQVSSPSRAKGFQVNTTNRLENRWIFLALAGISGAAVLVGPRRNRLGLGLAIGSVAFSLYAINYGLWMHYQDSLAYHPNLKQNEAPVKEKMQAEEKSAQPATTASAAASTASAPRSIRPLP